MDKNILLQELETLADKLDLTIRYEDGYFKGGLCRIKDEQYIIINKKCSIDKKITLLADALSKFDLSEIYILPQLREIISKEAASSQ